jgi:hypothetical protein
MLGNLQRISVFSIDWKSIVPMLRYVIGSCMILAVTSLLNYDLAYLTSVLSLSLMAPGTKPLTLKQSIGAVLILAVITGFAVLFTELFMEYSLVFMPLLLLSMLWLYYTDKLPMIVKVFALVSLTIIPFVSIDASIIGSYVAVHLVYNAFMAILLTQIVFAIFPLCEADIPFEKKKKQAGKQSESQRFRYAVSIILILTPVLILFYMFKLSSSILVITFIAILSVSPALANPKFGLVMITANVIGGLFGILAYQLLVIVPNFVFMILLTFGIGIFFGSRLFSDSKYAPIFGSGFSTFLLILGSVTSSDAEAGAKVWSRVIQISVAVSYIVFAFAVMQQVFPIKKNDKV